jgi:hypothetical protein
MNDGLSSPPLALKRYLNSVDASRMGWARVFKTVQFGEMGSSQDK